MIFDTHMHCQYSIDSKMSAEEANYYRTLG